MFGLTSCLHTANRTRMIGLGVAIAALLALLVWMPSAANASGCEDSWTNTAGGSWFEGTNWSKKAPPTSEEEACITESGTYTVEMDQKSTVTVKSLTVGGTSGTQTLVVASTNGLNAVLTTSAGVTNGAHGAITLTNSETNGNNVTVVGPVNNAGKLTTEPDKGGQRNLQGALTNTGTLAIKTNTSFNGSKAALTNKSSLTLATGVQLIASNESSVTNSGGTIAATGTGDVLMEPGTTFTEGAGATSGTKPVILRNAALKYTGSGKSLLTQHGEGNTLSGNLAAGQSLVLESTNGENQKTTASASFTNAGTITLTKSEANDNNSRLAITSGNTLTSSGTITSEAAENTGHRFIEGSITNKGTLNIDSDTEYNAKAATLTNEGTIALATGAALIGSNETSVVNASGAINATGTGVVFMEPGTSFTQGAGTTSGAKPVILRDAALVYTGSGESKITQHGEGNTLSGNLAAGQSLVLESTNGENQKTTASASFTNAGTITLTKSEANDNNSRLAITSGNTLTSSGTITSEAAENTGHRFLEGSITNTGTLAIDSDTEYNTSKATLTNEGTIDLAEGTTLDVSNDGTVTNGTGGKIAAGLTGNVVVEPGGAFTEVAGTTSGAKPVILRDAALVYTGSGESKITQHGEGNTLSGNLAAGQSLVLESTNGENEKTTASESFTNAGTITLTKSQTNNNNARLAISSGTLTNTGTITSEAAEGGGHRFLEGSITNKGTLAIDSDTEYNTSKATLTNEGTIDLATGVALSVSGTATVNNNGGAIAATGTGALVQVGGTFNEGLGKATGTVPVILEELALNYTGKGAGTIALRGTSTLSGPINGGQTLSIQSTCSKHANVTATTVKGSFTNSGTIVLTNGDGCGNNATFNLAGGTLINKGTINAEEPHGGSRTIEGTVKNEKTVAAGAGATLKVTGTYTQTKGGTLKTSIGSTSSYGVLAVTGTATITGIVTEAAVNKFKGALGQHYNILTSSALTGTFTKETGGGSGLSNGLYFKPTYSASGVTLEVVQATLVLSVTSGLPGTVVKLSGVGYMPEDTITPSFTDKGKTKTTYTAVKTNSSGEFSTEITIPLTAAEGAGKINVASANTGLSFGKTFTVS